MMFYLVIACALITAYINGMHDGGTIVATCVTSRILKPRTAVVLSGIFNLFGALFLGTSVAYTVGESLIETARITAEGSDYACRFVISVFAASLVWNLITWFIRLPSSASLSLIGSLIGCMLAACGPAAVHWETFLIRVVAAMLISPVIGFIAGFLLLKLETTLLRNATMEWSGRVKTLNLLATILLSLSYGSNDSQKIVGVCIIAVAAGSADVTIPFWLILVCGGALAVGTMTGGYNMIGTVGRGIVKMDIDKSLSSQLSAMLVTEFANLTGLPISSTQVLTGAIIGSGAESTPRSVHWGIIRNILMAWVLTLPAAAAAGYAVYKVMILF